MNPFDLRGPEFLLFWSVGWVVVVAATLFVHSRLASASSSKATVDELVDKLHPTEIGYLLGGLERAIEAAVVGLHQLGYLEIVDSSKQVRRTNKRVIGELSRVEQYVIDRLERSTSSMSVRELRDGAKSVDIVVRRMLESQGLLVEKSSGARIKLLTPTALWLAVGITKIGVGVSRQKPSVILLVLCLAVALIVPFLLKPPRLTTKGSELDEHLQLRYSALELTAKTAPGQLDSTDMMLAYGVFGNVVVAGALCDIMPSYQAALRAMHRAPGDSSCSSGGCGSSCGGGCGGGCGGCG